MRNTLMAWAVLVGASALGAGCSSGSSNNNGSGGMSGGAGNSGTGGGSATGTGGGSSGTGGGSSSNCIIPTTWTDNLESIGNAKCLPCAQMNCCDLIVKCAANQDCVATYSCEQDCYNNKGPDGSFVADDDAGTDDAGMTAMDRCVADCKANGPAAGKTDYDNQDHCINDQLPNTCGQMDVCY